MLSNEWAGEKGGQHDAAADRCGTGCKAGQPIAGEIRSGR